MRVVILSLSYLYKQIGLYIAMVLCLNCWRIFITHNTFYISFLVNGVDFVGRRFSLRADVRKVNHC